LKDVQKELRLSVFNAISGAMDVFDEKAEGPGDSYVILSTQTGTPYEENQINWNTRATIDLQLIHKTFSSVSKNQVDTMADTIMEIMEPSVGVIGIIPPAGFQYLNLKRTSERSIPSIQGHRDMITRKLLTYQVDIVQQ
jgi:hypothetical protein